MDYKTGVAWLPGRVVCILTTKNRLLLHKIYQNIYISKNRIRPWVERGRFLINTCPSLVLYEKNMTQIAKVHFFKGVLLGADLLRDKFLKFSYCYQNKEGVGVGSISISVP